MVAVHSHSCIIPIQIYPSQIWCISPIFIFS